MERMGLTLLISVYLGLLPCFLAQLRWLAWRQRQRRPGPGDLRSQRLRHRRLLHGPVAGRHPHDAGAQSEEDLGRSRRRADHWRCWSPIGIDSSGRRTCLRGNVLLEIAFGISVGASGMLGDLAESLLKRDCRHKDASQVVPASAACWTWSMR